MYLQKVMELTNKLIPLLFVVLEILMKHGILDHKKI